MALMNSVAQNVRYFWTKPPSGPRRVRCSCHMRQLKSQERMFVIRQKGSWLSWLFGDPKSLIFCEEGARKLGAETTMPVHVAEYPGT